MQNRRQILVVDDEEPLRSMLREVIESEFDCDVVEAVNGQEALEVLDTGLDPALLVCDVRMPIMDGIELLQHLQTDRRSKRPPVVLCSGVNDRHTILRAAHLSVAGYVLKPFEPPTLIAKLGEVLGAISHDGTIDALQLSLGVSTKEFPQCTAWLTEDLQQACNRCRQAGSTAELRYALFHIDALAKSLRAAAASRAIEIARSQLNVNEAITPGLLEPMEKEMAALIQHLRKPRAEAGKVSAT